MFRGRSLPEMKSFKSLPETEASRKAMDEKDFQSLIGKIRRRHRQELSGQWFNIIEAAGQRFLQGPISANGKPCGPGLGLAYITRRVRAEDIAGFWPETVGRLLDSEETAFLTGYITALDGREVELIVPLRNRSRPVRWDSFEDSREYPLYESAIYPEVLKSMSALSFRRLLDVGCGGGNLLAAIRQAFPQAFFAGIDISPDNVATAQAKGFSNISEGDGEDVATIYAAEPPFDMIIFCGLLNRQITDADTARKILKSSLTRLARGGHMIITGYSSCHFTSRDLRKLGLTVLKKSIPGNIFKDYDTFYLRQLYVVRRD